MKHTLILICIFSTLMMGCSGEKPEKEQSSAVFVNDIRLRTTPVKHQQGTELCWAFAMLATIETEHIMRGDSIDLSAAYVGRMFLLEQTLRHYTTQTQHEINTRGMMPMLPRLLERYGAMPFTSYRMRDKINIKTIGGKLQHLADVAYTHRAGTEALASDATNLLDEEMGPTPESVFMMGCQYTPLEFAHSVMSHEEYVALTSFTHHPWGMRFALEVPDNKYQDDFLNVRLDSLMKYIDKALHAGHPVCWEGDITEPLFDFSKGYALMANDDQQVTQQSRQAAFDCFETTDDHCMEIVGIAHNQQGKKFYLCKNSWGNQNPYKGFMYLSENYIRAKTIAIMMPAAALPPWEQIRKGLEI